MRRARRLSVFFSVIAAAALVVFASGTARADGQMSGSEFSVMVGPLMGNYSVSSSSGASLQQSFSEATTIDGTYEIFNNTHRSTFFRATFAYDMPSAVLKYAYAGAGMNFYIGSNGMVFDANDGHDQVIDVPKRRFFIGPDLGIAEVALVGISQALTVESGMFDMGAHAGFVQSLGKSFGIEALVGASYGFGFTTVAATGTALRVFVGISQYF